MREEASALGTLSKDLQDRAMPTKKYAELFQHLKVYILDLIGTVGGGSGPYAPSPHGLLSSHHTGNLADSQAPQFLKTDGSRQLIGNLSVVDGITIDGVDISNFKSLYDIHIATAAATAHAGIGIHSHQSDVQGSKLDHGLALIGLLDDDHTQYAHAEGSGTRRAYEAGRLNLSILAGNGLTGGGLMTQDRTLSIDFTRANTWTGAQTFSAAINAQGGINVGTATGASGGNIFASGAIHADGAANSYIMGNFGVKNNNPVEAVDVTGNIQASGIIKINGIGNNYLAGNLGLGATSLSGRLHIAQGTGATLYVESSPSDYPTMYVGRASGQPSIRGISDSDMFVIEAGLTGKTALNYYGTGDVILALGGGKVGVGLDTILSEKLQIAGGIKASGHLQIDGADTSYVMGSFTVGRSSSIYKFDVAGTANIDTSLRVPILNAPQSLTVNPSSEILLQPGNDVVRLMSNVSIQSDNYASQTTGWRITYSGDADFRYLFVNEMHAKAFITDLEQSLAGGQIICKSVGVLADDFELPTAGNSATFYVKDLPSAPGMALFETGDFIAFRQFSRANGALTISWAWGTVSNYMNWSNGTQSWTFTRDNTTPGTASGTIYADALVLDFGITGNGFYEVNAIDGTYGVNSPYAQIVTWNTHPATQTVNARFGNLKGITSNSEYGLIAGTGTSSTSQYIKLSNIAAEVHNVPVNLYDGSNIVISLDQSVPAIRIGASLPTYTSGAGIWMGKDNDIYKFRAGDPNNVGINWDGANLYINSNTNNYLKFTGSAMQFYNNTLPILQITNTPEVTIGFIAPSQSNIYITDGSIQIRNNTTKIIELTSDGVLNINNSNGITILQFSSNGSFISNILKMTGNNSAISIGITPPTYDNNTQIYNGTGIYIHNLGIVGLHNNNMQIKIDTNSGKLIFADGSMFIDKSGITSNTGSNIINVTYQNATQAGIYSSPYATPNGNFTDFLFYSMGATGASGTELAPDWDFTIGGTSNWQTILALTSIENGYNHFYIYNGGIGDPDTARSRTVNYITGITGNTDYDINSRLVHVEGDPVYSVLYYRIYVDWYDGNNSYINTEAVVNSLNNPQPGNVLMVQKKIKSPSNAVKAKITLEVGISRTTGVLYAKVDYFSFKASVQKTTISLRPDMMNLNSDGTMTLYSSDYIKLNSNTNLYFYNNNAQIAYLNGGGFGLADASRGFRYGGHANERTFTASGTGDLIIPLGYYICGTLLKIKVAANGGWATHGAEYVISKSWGLGPITIPLFIDKGVGDRLKFYYYSDGDGAFYLFATWENQSPNKSYVNDVDITIYSTNDWIARYGNFYSATQVSPSGQYIADNGSTTFSNNITVKDSNYNKMINGANYAGYLYVPLSPPGLNTNWDRVAKAVGSYTLYASDFGAPNTAKALIAWIISKWSSAGEVNYLALRNSASIAYGAVRAHVANTFIDGYVIVPLDSSGQFIAQISGNTSTSSSIYIVGYFI